MSKYPHPEARHNVGEVRKTRNLFVSINGFKYEKYSSEETGTNNCMLLKLFTPILIRFLQVFHASLIVVDYVRHNIVFIIVTIHKTKSE